MSIDSMNPKADTTPEKLQGFPYVIGGLSFIPLMGVPFGIIAILWGLLTKKRGGKRLALIGAAGICFTIILFGGSFYFGLKQRGGVYDKLRARQAQANLDSLVQSIEYYKVQHGTYPESLKALQESLPKDSLVSILVHDLTEVKSGLHQRYFFYERVGEDHYYLRSLGLDGQPFTSDDIVPQVSAMPGSKVGLLLEHKTNE